MGQIYKILFIFNTHPYIFDTNSLKKSNFIRHTPIKYTHDYLYSLYNTRPHKNKQLYT